MLPEDKLWDIFKLWSEKCKMLCYINHNILVTTVTKRTRWPPLLFVKIHVWYSKGVFVPNLRKIQGVEIARSHYLKWDSLTGKGFIIIWMKRREAENMERHDVARARAIVLLRNQLSDHTGIQIYIWYVYISIRHFGCQVYRSFACPYRPSSADTRSRIYRKWRLSKVKNNKTNIVISCSVIICLIWWLFSFIGEAFAALKERDRDRQTKRNRDRQTETDNGENDRYCQTHCAGPV